MGLEGVLKKLAFKLTGKRTTRNSVESILQFMVDNYPEGNSSPATSSGEPVAGVKTVTAKSVTTGKGEYKITFTFVMTNGEKQTVIVPLSLHVNE